jgi:hypothetical protein
MSSQLDSTPHHRPWNEYKTTVTLRSEGRGRLPVSAPSNTAVEPASSVRRGSRSLLVLGEGKKKEKGVVGIGVAFAGPWSDGLENEASGEEVKVNPPGD